MDNKELFAKFLKSFIAPKLPLLANVKPEDIKDYKSDYYPLDTDSKHADVVKKVSVKDNTLFFVALVEHQSSVNYRMSFRILTYIVFILLEYEKEMEAMLPGITKTKDFKYPPVVPIIFYDGKGEWDAPLNFLDKCEMSSTFHKYIPKYESELINLNKVSDADIMKLKDVLSVFLLLDKRRGVEDAEQFIRSVLGYIQTIDFEPQLRQLVATIAEGLLENAKAPRHIIEKVVDEIVKGRTPTMFEGLLEAFEEKNAQIERAEAEKERAVKKMYAKGQSVEDIADILNLPIERVLDITQNS
jgi:predicted transposase YdaD